MIVEFDGTYVARDRRPESRGLTRRQCRAYLAFLLIAMGGLLYGICVRADANWAPPDSISGQQVLAER